MIDHVVEHVVCKDCTTGLQRMQVSVDHLWL